MLTRGNLNGVGLTAALSLFAFAIGGWAGSGPLIVPAAAQGTVALEEIVVTARKREENLMEVPLAITAFTSGDIESLGLKSIQDISQFTPSFHFNQETGGGSGRNDRSSRLLIFRGMSIAGGILFVDGAQVQGNTPPPIGDVERIEVLSGPQSVYFGRSTFMGALNFVMKEPGDEFKGRLITEAGSFGSNEGSLSVEGPLLGDKLTGRISGNHSNVGGQYKNFGDPSEKFGKQQTDSVSATVVARPSDDWNVKVWGTFYEDNDGPPAQIAFKGAELNCNLGGTRGRYWCGTLPDVSDINPSLISGNYAVTPYMYREIIDNRLGFYTVFDPKFSTHGGIRRKAYQGDARIEYESSDGYTFTSLTSAHKSKTQVILDLAFRDGRPLRNPYFGAVCPTCALAALPFPTWFLMSQNRSHDFNQEIRVTSPGDDRLRWVAGANYLTQYTVGALYGVKVNGTASSSTPAINHPKTPSVFGGAYYDITPELTATVEARYQWDKVKNDVIGASTGFLLPTPVLFAAQFKSFSPRVSLDYKYNEDSTAYLLFSRGFRPGGFNAALTTQPASVVSQFVSVGITPTFDEEKIDNYELGVKSTFLDGAARTTLAIYYAKWRNGQISTSVPFTTTTGQLNLLAVTQNLGAVDLKGGEFEADFRVNQELTLSATASLNTSKVKVFTCGDCLSVYGSTNAVGNRLGQAEKYKFTLSGDYRAHLTGDYDWLARIDYAYRGKYFLDVSNRASAPAQNTVNAKIGVATENLQINAFVRNLLKDDGLRGYLGLDILSMTPAHPALDNELRIALPDKRTFGIRASYNF